MRRGAWLLLALAVLAVHLWLADQVRADRFGLGAAATMPERMQVAFVRELREQAPPATPVRPSAVTAPALRKPVATPAPAASAPADGDTALLALVAASAPVLSPVPEPVAAPVAAPSPPEPASRPAADLPASAPAAVVLADAASAPAPAAASATPAAVWSPAVAASSPPAEASVAFEWPPSTRLSYRLTGNYRGPVEGQAQVEWLLQGPRYQVHMDLSIGPRFAALASRRVSSEGRITAQGLAPQRYDEETKALFRQTRRLTVWLDEHRVRLANNTEQPRPAGVQDSASQFVHLTWLFTTQPELLQAGRSVTLPLALPNHLEPWTYDVVGAEALQTPAGEVQTFHVKPRRAPRAGVDLTAELWVAPSLQYLPVRILIRQDAETFLDLLIERLPQQAAPGR